MAAIQRSSLFLLLILITTVVFKLCVALEVAPDSQCSSLCIDVPGGNVSDRLSSSTQTSDTSCYDSLYDSTPVGRKFKGCVGCESTSARVDTSSTENDLYWLLFNLKFTVDWCVFGFPENPQNVATKCSGVCDPLQVALIDRLLEPNTNLQYQYCADGYPTAFMSGVDACSNCLATVPNQTYLSGFLKALKSGCQQKPKPGKTLSLNMDLFPSITTSLSSSTSANTQPIATSSLTQPTSNYTSLSITSSGNASVSGVTESRGPSMGAMAGIGAGIGVTALAAVLFFTIHCRSRRRKGLPYVFEKPPPSKNRRSKESHSWSSGAEAIVASLDAVVEAATAPIPEEAQPPPTHYRKTLPPEFSPRYTQPLQPVGLPADPRPMNRNTMPPRMPTSQARRPPPLIGLPPNPRPNRSTMPPEELSAWDRPSRPEVDVPYEVERRAPNFSRFSVGV